MPDSISAKKAILFSATEPNEIQKKRFSDFVKEKYGKDVEFVWEKDKTIKKGFRLQVGSEVYDWSVKGLYAQLKQDLKSLSGKPGDIISLLTETVEEWEPKAIPNEFGTVQSVGDGIATVTGLERVAYGEIVIFASGAKGMVLDLNRDKVGCILFGDEATVFEGSSVRRTGKTAGMPVGEEFLGRVVDPLGNPIDGKGKIRASAYLPIENPAPGIIDRQPVSEPLETGLLAIDSMFPIGRGQRELIIGDRQTGKTAIAVDTIINQKGKDVVCVYVAIGQKASSVAQLKETLRKQGAMDYTIIVNASASDPSPVLYIAPYAGCALGEYFMNKGQDVLIVYDDLSKHAVAYRSLSLLLGRSPGREAYPGDVFYLHSRLLERSARLSEERGGGSMTALPIVETQAGDVSAYIPTNIISITDGQIFLESDLFFAGQRPAVNVGISVSRVGGDAQTKAMKRATGTLRLDLAQYREMEVFTQFSSDLDETTKRQLIYGQGLMRLLRQEQYSPMTQLEQILTLIAALSGAMIDVPLDKIDDFRKGFIEYAEENATDICRDINNTKDLSPETKTAVEELAKKYRAAYENGGR